jgi:hypothetical protein
MEFIREFISENELENFVLFFSCYGLTSFFINIYTSIRAADGPPLPEEPETFIINNDSSSESTSSESSVSSFSEPDENVTFNKLNLRKRKKIN